MLPVRDIVRRPGEMREHHLTIPLTERWGGEGLVAVEEGEELDIDVRLESVHEASSSPARWIPRTAESADDA